MTLVAPALRRAREVTTPRRVAVMPAYNEEATIVAVLEALAPLADEIIVVDDGSSDGTRDLLVEWSSGRSNVRLLCFSRNRGMSAAYHRAFEEVARRVAIGELSPDDVVLTVDADGQHDPSEVDALVDDLVEGRLDAVIARRDLSTYTAYKRAGNFLMSAWASLWAGLRIYDVESGFRVFRIGALLAALRYYKGHKYSETVEVVVILARLGYRLDNSRLVPVPVFRSNTRLKDLAIDLAVMPAAFWRVVSRRDAPPGLSKTAAYLLPLLVPALLMFMAVNVLTHALFLANDSIQHYSHVWYLSDQIFHHGRLPLHVALLDGGRAMAFPYGFAPYLTGAALYPLFGDWATSLLLVAGTLALIWAACLARPDLRNPWFLAFFVFNPFFIDAVYSFQLASIWSLAFFFAFVWSFERGRVWLPWAFLALSIADHPVMGLFAVSVYALYVAMAARGATRRFLAIAVLAGAAASPFLAMSLATPALGENSIWKVTLSILDVVGRRGTIVVLPLLLPLAAGWIRANYAIFAAAFSALLVAGLAFSLGLVRFGDLNRGSYFGAFHNSHDVYAAFFVSAAFEPGATYRVMEPTEREDGMYRFMRRGAVISNEFFGESMMRRNWTEAELACYAAYKGIDFDVVEYAYDREYHKNEGALLAGLVQSGGASRAYSDPAERFEVYDLRPLISSRPRPRSLAECAL